MLSALDSVAWLLSFCGIAHAAIIIPRQTNDTKIDWRSCPSEYNDIAELPILCANLSVPLDYTDANNKATHTVELMKVEAVDGPSLGSIIFSWGGPGAEGMLNMAQVTSFHMNFTGRRNDLISFNARGTSSNFLNISCFDQPQRTISKQQMLKTFDASDVSLGELWADGGVSANMCKQKAQEVGSYIGTAATARDVMQIVDALDDGPLLNYYGPSYGTVLGATIAAMFPDRIGTMVLDGVLNPHEYWRSFVNAESSTSADATFSEFFKRCVETSSTLCPLNRNGSTAAELEAKIYGLIESTKHNPIALPAEFVDFDALYLGTKVDYSGLKNAITTTLYHPFRFSAMAAALQGLLDGNFTDLASWRDFASKIFSNAATGEATLGIFCGDRVPRAASVDELLPSIRQAAAVSRLAGQDWLNTITTTPCAQWPFEAKERYLGDFTAKTANPVLIVGNTFDPVTPLASAHNVSAGLVGSIVVERVAFGHTSQVQPSKCSEEIIANYFVNKTIPEHNTVCDTDSDAFDLSKLA